MTNDELIKIILENKLYYIPENINDMCKLINDYMIPKNKVINVVKQVASYRRYKNADTLIINKLFKIVR